MPHQLRSAAASPHGRSPALAEDTVDEDVVEGVKAIAVSDQRTIYLVRLSFPLLSSLPPHVTVASPKRSRLSFWRCLTAMRVLSAPQVNMFIANTVEFLNSFAALCDDKLALLHR
jgi:hypothetical protein